MTTHTDKPDEVVAVNWMTRAISSSCNFMKIPFQSQASI
jgi:hypothetical protein